MLGLSPQILEYTKAGEGTRLRMLIPHNDAERQYAYGPAQGLSDSKVVTFTRAFYDKVKKAAAVFKTKEVLLGVFPQHWESTGGTDNVRPAQRSTNIQYFYWYFVTPTFTVGAAPNILIYWTKEERNRYTVPIGIGASYTRKIGKIPIKFQAEYHYAVKHPEDIPGQRDIIRFTITPVLPNPFANK